MSKLTPPQPTDIWKDDKGKVWYEYSMHDILEYENWKIIMGKTRERAPQLQSSRSTANQQHTNITMDMV